MGATAAGPARRRSPGPSPLSSERLRGSKAAAPSNRKVSFACSRGLVAWFASASVPQPGQICHSGLFGGDLLDGIGEEVPVRLAFAVSGGAAQARDQPRRDVARRFRISPGEDEGVHARHRRNRGAARQQKPIGEDFTRLPIRAIVVIEDVREFHLSADKATQTAFSRQDVVDAFRSTVQFLCQYEDGSISPHTVSPGSPSIGVAPPVTITGRPLNTAAASGLGSRQMEMIL